MDTRQRYFALMETVIYEGNYVYLFFKKHHRAYQWIRAGICALMIGSLVAWLLCRELPILRLLVLIPTAIIFVNESNFKISKRVEVLEEITKKFKRVLRRAETDWRRIDSENLSDEAIESMMQQLELSVANVRNKLKSLGMKDDMKICKAASERTGKYIETCFLNVG